MPLSLLLRLPLTFVHAQIQFGNQKHFQIEFQHAGQMVSEADSESDGSEFKPQ